MTQKVCMSCTENNHFRCKSDKCLCAEMDHGKEMEIVELPEGGYL